MDQMQQLRMDFRDQIQAHIAERGLERNNNVQVMNNLDDCICSAEVVASVASTIVHSRSTTASHSQMHNTSGQNALHERTRLWLENVSPFVVSGSLNDEILASSSLTSMTPPTPDPSISTVRTTEQPMPTASPTNPFRRMTSILPPDPSITTTTFLPPTPAPTDHGRVGRIHRKEPTITFPKCLCRVTDGVHKNEFFSLQSVQYQQIETTLPRLANVVISPTCRTLAVYYESAEYGLEFEIFGISEASAFTLLCNGGIIDFARGSKVILADKYMAIQRYDAQIGRVKTYDTISGNLIEALPKTCCSIIGPIAINSSGSMMAVNAFENGDYSNNTPSRSVLHLYRMSVAGSYRNTKCFTSIIVKTHDLQVQGLSNDRNTEYVPISCQFSPDERYVSISYSKRIVTYDVTRQGQLVSEKILVEHNDLYGLYLLTTNRLRTTAWS